MRSVGSFNKDFCVTRTGPRHIRCGKPRSFWSNYMEPLCTNCFYQRRVIQNWMVMLSGCGNWASLVYSRNLTGLHTLPHGYEGVSYV